MRLFLAVNLPPELRARAWEGAEPLRAALPTGVAWVREEALHVTVRFLGDQPADLPDRLAAELGAPLARAETPRVELRAVGAFPSMRRPRVLWIGGPPNSRLAALYHEVERACGRLGFEPEGREFHPHVTLGRVRQGSRLDPAALERAAGEVRLDESFVAPTLDVMESELSPAGARYRVLAAVPIGPRG